MATNASRLGRGLGSLIQNGASPLAQKSTPQKQPARNNKNASTLKNKRPSVHSDAAAQITPEKPLTTTSVDTSINTDYIEVLLSRIDPNPYQPRKAASSEGIQELAESIRSEGLLQPIVVRLVEKRYQIIAGERRWRACQLLKWKAVTVRVIEASNVSSAVMALIENLQRENLNPIDEALGYASLMSDFDLTQQGVSERVGKGRASIANALRLLQLDSEIQGFIKKNLLSMGHAKVLAGVENPTQRNLLARQTIEQQFSVRELERRIKRSQSQTAFTLPNPQNASRSTSSEIIALNDLEKRLTDHLNTRVIIQKGTKKNKLIIEYRNNDDLDHVLDRMGFSQ